MGSALKSIYAPLHCIAFMKVYRATVYLLPVPLTQQDIQEQFYNPCEHLQPCEPPEGTTSSKGQWYKFTDDIVFFQVLNTAWIAYDAQFAPGLKPGSGHLDLVFMRRPTRMQ